MKLLSDLFSSRWTYRAISLVLALGLAFMLLQGWAASVVFVRKLAATAAPRPAAAPAASSTPGVVGVRIVPVDPASSGQAPPP